MAASERKERQSLNKKIIHLSKKLLSKYGEFFSEDNTAFCKFEDVSHPHHMVELDVAHDQTAKDDGIIDFADIPGNFEYPVYILNSWGGDSDKSRVSTPYGRQPKIAIGSDNKLYTFSNIYFFNEKGKSARYEEVFCLTIEDESLEDSLKNWGYDSDDILRINIKPEEKDSRYMDLDPGDYEKIIGTLRQVEAGLFAPYNPH